MSELRITDIKFRPVKKTGTAKCEIAAMANIVLNDEIMLMDLPIFEWADSSSLSVNAPFTEYDRLSFYFESPKTHKKIMEEILDAYVAYKNGIKESRRRPGRMLKEFYFEDPEDARWELNQGEYECCYCGREVTGAEGYCRNDDGEICCIDCYKERFGKNESRRRKGSLVESIARRTKKYLG